MTQSETDFSPISAVDEKIRTTTKTDISTPMNFLGLLLRENPDCLGEIGLIEKYILLARSETTVRPTYEQLGEVFGKSAAWVMHLYKDSMTTIWNTAPISLQETYPLTVIFDSNRELSPRTRAKMIESHRGKTKTQEQRIKIGEGVKESFKDPEVKRKIIANAKRRTQTSETKAKIGNANRGKKRSLDARIMMGKSQTERYKKPEERKKTSQAVIGRSIRQDKGRVSNEDSGLWKYAVSHNLINEIINRGFLTEAEVNSIRAYFKGGSTPKNLSKLLNKLSLGVARLA